MVCSHSDDRDISCRCVIHCLMFRPGDDPDSLREFYRSVWNIWFDQTFPPTPPESEWEEDESEEPEEEIKEEKPKR